VLRQPLMPVNNLHAHYVIIVPKLIFCSPFFEYKVGKGDEVLFRPVLEN
jgi:hypothetical protein